MERQLYIDQTRISHIIPQVWFDKNILKGIVECAKTNVGIDMQNLIRQKSQVAFSLRAMGPCTERKGDILHIKSPLHILCYDWVIHPSHSIAYMQKIISESTMDMLNPKDADMKTLNEGYMIPIYEKEIVDYLEDESYNVKQMKEQFNIDKDAIITISEDKKMVDIRQGHDILKVYIEDYLRQEVDNYFSKF